MYGGLFTSYQVLDEPDRPSLYNQWADVIFCSSDGLTIWNATIITTAADFWDKIEDMAHTRAWKLLTNEEREREVEMKFEPVLHGGRKYYQLLEREKQRYEKFGGLTHWEYQDRLNNKIILNDPPDVFEYFATDKSYRYGIGLHIVTHVDEINQKTIEQAIEIFRKIGETDWRADRPVMRDELPTESRNEAFSRISRLDDNT
jgi:hypothetical protein